MTFSLTTYDKGFWFRYNGEGLSVSWHGDLLFSERNGFEKFIKIGKLKIKRLSLSK